MRLHTPSLFVVVLFTVLVGIVITWLGTIGRWEEARAMGTGLAIGVFIGIYFIVMFSDDSD